jgi:hypothetical protein
MMMGVWAIAALGLASEPGRREAPLAQDADRKPADLAARDAPPVQIR